jgi:hypothetical protein
VTGLFLFARFEAGGPVSAAIALVAVDDRPIDGATDPSHAHTAPASKARHKEREEKGEAPRGRNRTGHGALTVKSVGSGSRLASRYSAALREAAWRLIRLRPRRGVSSNGASPGGLWRPLHPAGEVRPKTLDTGVALQRRLGSPTPLRFLEVHESAAQIAIAS